MKIYSIILLGIFCALVTSAAGEDSYRIAVYPTADAEEAVLVDTLTSGGELDFSGVELPEPGGDDETYYVDVFSGGEMIASREPLSRPMDVLGMELGSSGEYIGFAGDSLEMDGGKITGLPDPDNRSDAANKGYVDDAVENLGEPKAESAGIKLYRNY